MHNPMSKASVSALYHSMFHLKMDKDDTFDSFAKCLRLMHKHCTTTGNIPYEEAYLIRCFIYGLHSNFDSIRELLDSGALPWYNQDLNAVVQTVTDIKLNIEMTGTWKHFKATSHAIGEQGTKQPAYDATADTPTAANKDPSVPEYLYKTHNLSYAEVTLLLK